MLSKINSLLTISSGIILSHFATKYLLPFISSAFKPKHQPKFLLPSRTSPFIVVVGIGGVGSHVIMSLLRNGVTRIRVIDYDMVTLSSLNRHAFALRKDVGKLKSKLVIEYAHSINPDVQIEAIEDAFLLEHAEEYIKKGNPDYVIDCIDDLNSKVDLMNFCISHNIKLISSMGAAGKCDPSLIRFVDFKAIKGDSMGKRLRYQYNKKYKVLPSIPCVVSLEKTVKGLSDLEEHQKENCELFRVNFNERVRTLPVFACLPSSFGQCLAARVIGEVDGYDFNKDKEELTKEQKEKLVKYIQDYKIYEMRKKIKEKDIKLVYDDYLKIAKAFEFNSSVSCKVGNKMRFVRWRASKPIDIGNIVLLNKSEINQLYSVKKEEDLIKIFGKETVDRIDNVIQTKILATTPTSQ